MHLRGPGIGAFVVCTTLACADGTSLLSGTDGGGEDTAVASRDGGRFDVEAMDAGPTDRGPRDAAVVTMGCPAEAPPSVRFLGIAPEGLDLAPSTDRLLMRAEGEVIVAELPTGQQLSSDRGVWGALGRSGRVRLIDVGEGEMRALDEGGIVARAGTDRACWRELTPDRRFGLLLVGCVDSPAGTGKIGRLEVFDFEGLSTHHIDDDVILGSVRSAARSARLDRVAYLNRPVAVSCRTQRWGGRLSVSELPEPGPGGPTRATEPYETIVGFAPDGRVIAVEPCWDGTNARVRDVFADRLLAEGRVDVGWPARPTDGAAVWRSSIPEPRLGAEGILVTASGSVGRRDVVYHPYESRRPAVVLTSAPAIGFGVPMRIDGSDVAATVSFNATVGRVDIEGGQIMPIVDGPTNLVIVSDDGTRVAVTSFRDDTMQITVGGAQDTFRIAYQGSRVGFPKPVGFVPGSQRLLVVAPAKLWIEGAQDAVGIEDGTGGGDVVDSNLDLIVTDERGCWVAYPRGGDAPQVIVARIPPL